MLRNDTYIRLCRAKDMLRETREVPLLIHDVAREVSISPYHFIRLFKSTFGQTPHEFRTDMLLDKAKQLLVVSNLSVTEVCMEIGFSSVGSFSELFARHVGVPPSAYRRQLRSMIQVPGVFPRELMPHCFALMYGYQSS